MDEKEIAKFVVDYYQADKFGHSQEVKLILAKNPKVFNYIVGRPTIKHTLYNLYLSSALFDPVAFSEIQDSLDFRQLLSTVKKYPETIKYVKTNRRAYNRLLEEAINADSSVIRFFKSPSSKVKALAISKDPLVIYLIKNRSSEDENLAKKLMPTLTACKWLVMEGK